MTHDSSYPEGYIKFFEHYHIGEYWEAHEVLEEVWQKERENDFYHGLIQIAAIMHQLNRGKIAGARKLAVSAQQYLHSFLPEYMGVNVQDVMSWLQDLLQKLPNDVIRIFDKNLNFFEIPVCPLPRIIDR
ncbi:DUF309 domain-containing protein [Microaerobacter geothermalis]|uniref:DUF309 domain-containing protein n=1 Tax=Microaerobacter geothermalis TaxID=674972 RepID=UPI001F34B17F|nr:DUF309 domain-containing protein [Microaerobacter geothermalis]MCF6094109.1 DUF309 domain-containing protein [Microaerobacter geothermalis]